MKNRLGDQFNDFWEKNFEKVLFEKAIFKMYFLREQFWKSNKE